MSIKRLLSLADDKDVTVHEQIQWEGPQFCDVEETSISPKSARGAPDSSV